MNWCRPPLKAPSSQERTLGTAIRLHVEKQKEGSVPGLVILFGGSLALHPETKLERKASCLWSVMFPTSFYFTSDSDRKAACLWSIMIPTNFLYSAKSIRPPPESSRDDPE